MHLLALGAFWLGEDGADGILGEQVLMHLLALGAFWHEHQQDRRNRSPPVLMHLLGLFAFEGVGVVGGVGRVVAG